MKSIEDKIYDKWMNKYPQTKVNIISAMKEYFDTMSKNMYSEKEVNILLQKIVRDSNNPKYTIHVDDKGTHTMSQIFPFPKWAEQNLKQNIKKMNNFKNLTQGAQLTWAITQDHDVCNDCENATPEQIEQLKLAGYTEQFQMLDDDGELYYSGLAKPDADFDPLDDFGTPNAGCTDIKYYDEVTKQYKSL